MGHPLLSAYGAAVRLFSVTALHDLPFINGTDDRGVDDDLTSPDVGRCLYWRERFGNSNTNTAAPRSGGFLISGTSAGNVLA